MEKIEGFIFHDLWLLVLFSQYWHQWCTSKVDAKVKYLRVHLKMDDEYVCAESGITVINFLLLLTEDINPVWLDTTRG